MQAAKKRALADIAPGSDNPLSFAVKTRDQTILDMVRDALIKKNVLLAFQPVMQARDPAKVAFYEGLIRVLDDTGRVIPAADFIPVIEATELGRQIDVAALSHGMRALHNNPALRLSINMSARSIGYTPWMRTLDRWLSRDATLSERLILEITESSAMLVPELVADFMDRLQVKGICFAMDDFGAGYTSLAHFKDFFFDLLKIDSRFIRGIATDRDNQALVRAMVSIAQHFDLFTVAEFVENQADADMLITLGIDCLQGHHYGAATTRPHWLDAEKEVANA